jgi:hypothetical protein
LGFYLGKSVSRSLYLASQGKPNRTIRLNHDFALEGLLAPDGNVKHVAGLNPVFFRRARGGGISRRRLSNRCAREPNGRYNDKCDKHPTNKLAAVTHELFFCAIGKKPYAPRRHVTRPSRLVRDVQTPQFCHSTFYILKPRQRNKPLTGTMLFFFPH